MRIDTLLQLFSSSFNIFKKSIGTIVPFIILYTIVIYILSNKIFLLSNSFNPELLNLSIFDIIIPILFLALLGVSYLIILLNYIFRTINNQAHKINLIDLITSKTSILRQIIVWYSLLIIVSFLVSFILIFSNNFLITVIAFIGTYLLIVFVPPTMITKKYSLTKSVAYSYRLAINNIGSMLLFFGSVILVYFFSGIFIVIIYTFMDILNNNDLSELIKQILSDIVFYFVLIWFSMFYIKLSNSEQ